MVLAILAVAIGAAPGQISITYNHVPDAPPPFTSAQGYSFMPPDGWKSGPATAVACDSFFYFPSVTETFATSISVVVTPLDEKATLADIKPKLSKALATTTVNYKRIMQSDMEIDGQKAWMLVSNFDQGKPPQRLYSEEYVVVRGDKVYEFTYNSLVSDYAAHQADFEATVKTIKWTNLTKPK